MTNHFSVDWSKLPAPVDDGNQWGWAIVEDFRVTQI